jgi:hypothetical protein
MIRKELLSDSDDNDSYDDQLDVNGEEEGGILD